jgi:hypothetical protein
MDTQNGLVEEVMTSQVLVHQATRMPPHVCIVRRKTYSKPEPHNCITSKFKIKSVISHISKTLIKVISN